MDQERISELYNKLVKIIDSPNFAVAERIEIPPGEAEEETRQRLVQHISKQRKAIDEDVINMKNVKRLVFKITNPTLNSNLVAQVIEGTMRGKKLVHFSGLQEFVDIEEEKLGNILAEIADGPQVRRLFPIDGLPNVVIRTFPIMYTIEGPVKRDQNQVNILQSEILHELQHVVDYVGGVPHPQDNDPTNYKEYLSTVIEARAIYRELQFLLDKIEYKDLTRHYDNLEYENPKMKPLLDVIRAFLKEHYEEEELPGAKQERYRQERLAIPSSPPDLEVARLKEELKAAKEAGNTDEIEQLKAEIESRFAPGVRQRRSKKAAKEQAENKLKRARKKISRLENRKGHFEGNLAHTRASDRETRDYWETRIQAVENEIQTALAEIRSISESKESVDISRINNKVVNILDMFSASKLLGASESAPNTIE